MNIVYAIAAPSVSEKVRMDLGSSIADPKNPPIAEIKKRLADLRGQAKLPIQPIQADAAVAKVKSAPAQTVEPAKYEAE